MSALEYVQRDDCIMQTRTNLNVQHWNRPADTHLEHNQERKVGLDTRTVKAPATLAPCAVVLAN